MRRQLLVVSALCLLLVVGVVGCGRSSDDASVTQQTISVPGTDVETDGTAAPIDDTPGSLATKVPVSRVPKTFPPKSTTTRVPRTFPPKATTTKPPVTRAPRTTDPASVSFCNYAEQLNLSRLANAAFPDAFGTLYDAAVGSQRVAPPALVDPLNRVKAVLDQMKPMVDSGEISTVEQAGAWLYSQPAQTQADLSGGLDDIKTYYGQNCE